MTSMLTFDSANFLNGWVPLETTSIQNKLKVRNFVEYFKYNSKYEQGTSANMYVYMNAHIENYCIDFFECMLEYEHNATHHVSFWDSL